MNVESVHLSVTVFQDSSTDGQLPSWRDTIHVELTGSSLTGAQLSSLKSSAIAEALARYSAWKQAVLNPPAPEPEPAPSKDEALSQARDALQAAIEAVDAAAES